tara:strand:- start:1640 stop:3049 length:1410 start_codon:yes stop_codon:yes gene_type:complete
MKGMMIAMLVVVCGCAGGPTGEAESNRALNVILFVGDGMGVSTVTAARIYEGQTRGDSGEENYLSFERFPASALVKTYNTDMQVPDSAGTMTAMVTGRKVRAGAISVAADVGRGDCEAALDNPLPTILEQAEERGMATGIVSTATITHATPAATYAHSPERNWEADAMMPAAAIEAGCVDIARQLVEFPQGDGLDVMLGGGRAHFIAREQADPEDPGRHGSREDGRDLVADWLSGAENRSYVWNSEEFAAVRPEAVGQVLGLFERSHLEFEADRRADAGGEPSLADMTEFAIRRLRRDGEGYFLMVEAGRIDHAHHFSNAYRALVDTVALSDAVQRAVNLTSAADTLIIVTADHSHTFTISGYPSRGNPILGKVAVGGQEQLDAEGRPYTTLSYANGPGYLKELPDLTDVDTTAHTYRQIAAVPLPVETHAGEDVPAYARGPGADGVNGVMDQNEIYATMHQALWGDAE